MDAVPQPGQRVLYSVTETMRLLNLSRSQLYDLIRCHRLVTVTQGRRRLVPSGSISDYVALLLAEAKEASGGRAA